MRNGLRPQDRDPADARFRAARHEVALGEVDLLPQQRRRLARVECGVERHQQHGGEGRVSRGHGRAVEANCSTPMGLGSSGVWSFTSSIARMSSGAVAVLHPRSPFDRVAEDRPHLGEPVQHRLGVRFSVSRTCVSYRATCSWVSSRTVFTPTALVNSFQNSLEWPASLALRPGLLAYASPIAFSVAEGVSRGRLAPCATHSIPVRCETRLGSSRRSRRKTRRRRRPPDTGAAGPAGTYLNPGAPARGRQGLVQVLLRGERQPDGLLAAQAGHRPLEAGQGQVLVGLKEDFPGLADPPPPVGLVEADDLRAVGVRYWAGGRPRFRGAERGTWCDGRRRATIASAALAGEIRSRNCSRKNENLSGKSPDFKPGSTPLGGTGLVRTAPHVHRRTDF